MAVAAAAVVVVELDAAGVAVEEEEEEEEEVEEEAGGRAEVCLGPWWQRGTAPSLNRWRWSRRGPGLRA